MFGLVLAVLLNVRETAGVARHGEVVRSGVPIPRSLNLRATNGLAIVDATGRAVPAEFEILARWNAGRADVTAPAQWLLVTYPASVDANGSAAYRLITDGTVANPPPQTPLVVTRSDSRFTIASGGVTFAITPESLFDEIRVGANTIARGGTLAARANETDTRYLSTRRAFVEHAGPLRTTIVVEGTYDLPAIGGGRLSSERRYTFTADSPTAIVRQTLAWEGQLCETAGAIVCNGAPDALRILRVRDTLGSVVTAPSQLTITGARGSSRQLAVVPGETASLAQLLRARRTDAPRFEIAAGGQTTSGARADGGQLVVQTGGGSLSVAFDHMHRFEPQALCLLADGSIAIDLASDQAWLGTRQALYATFAVSAAPQESWAALNHPLRAWPAGDWFASSQAVGDLPAGPLRAEYADYDRAVGQALDNTVRLTDSLGIFGLTTWGLYPRFYGNPVLTDEIDCFGNDPTPEETWDDLYWCSTWTDYHNTAYTAAARAMRTGEVQWIGELTSPAALRQLYTQIERCSPDDPYFYCGMAPAGYGGYRENFNSSHAYFDNLQLYYWLTGDRAVLETLERGARTIRDYFCSRRPAAACTADDPPTDEFANLTGRVASQWNATFRFVGLASDDASFLEDYRNNLGRAVTQQYLSLGGYGFLLGGWIPVTVPGRQSTDQLWMTALYDTKVLEQLQRDTNDALIGNPPLRPSEILLSLARTLQRYGPTTATGSDGTVAGAWPNQLDVTWSGPRVGGSILSVAATPGGGDPLLYDTGKATLSGPVARAAAMSGDASLLALARELARLAIAASLADPSGLGKSQGEYLARLHTAVANLSPPATGGKKRSVRK